VGFNIKIGSKQYISRNKWSVQRFILHSMIFFSTGTVWRLKIDGGLSKNLVVIFVFLEVLCTVFNARVLFAKKKYQRK
jgi:hypothetical protein